MAVDAAARAVSSGEIWRKTWLLVFVMLPACEAGPPAAIDYAMAAACFAAFTVPVMLGAGSSAHGPGVVAAFGAAAAAPLAVRRRWPIAVVAVVTAVYVTATLAGVAFTPFVSKVGPDLAIAVFTAADRSPRRWSGAAAALTWAALPAGLHLHPRQDQDAVQLVAVVVAWIAGDVVRALRVYRQQLDFEKRRRFAGEQERARAEERLRLSRDVHDVISHSLSAIAVQAGMARLVLAQQPGEAGAALSAIETTSRSALDELRKLLRQIRDPDADDEAATPTLSELPALIDKLRAGGDAESASCGLLRGRSLTAGRPGLRRCVIGHRDGEAGSPVVDLDAGPRAVRVPGDVRERLLGDGGCGNAPRCSVAS